MHIKNEKGFDDAALTGVTAIRDAGTKAGIGLTIARERRSAPAVVVAGWALYKKGGYGSLLGVPVETSEEIRTEIIKLKGAGAGIIKIIASGMVSLKRPGSITTGGFSPGELRFIVDNAAALGLAVMTHANGETAIIAAAEAGVRSVEHGFFMTERALEAMARHGTYWTPTVGALARAADSTTMAKEMKIYVAGLIASQLAMIGRAWEIGVPLAVGTDCVLPDPEYKKIYDAELSYFERAGISREDVLHIACEDGARLLGLNNII